MIVVNVRALLAPLTGVQRVTLELLRRFPSDAVRQVGPPEWLGLAGKLAWEQAVLPKAVRPGERLWSPANVGPILVRRQVLMVHDLATFDCPTDYAYAYRAWHAALMPLLVPRVEALLTVSEFSRDRIIRQFRVDPASVHMVHPAIDHARFRLQTAQDIAAVRKAMALPERYVLYLGTHSPRKNLGALLEAWATIQDAVDPDIVLVVAGEAGTSRVFRPPHLPRLPPRTRMVGRVPELAIAPLLAGAMLFVFPSLYEGFGLPPLEAMACGTPCLVSSAGALPEAVDGAADLFDPYRPGELAERLEALLNDETQRRRLTSAGLVHVRRFDWDDAARRVWNVLNAG